MREWNFLDPAVKGRRKIAEKQAIIRGLRILRSAAGPFCFMFGRADGNISRRPGRVDTIVEMPPELTA